MSVVGSAQVLVLLGALVWTLTGHYAAPALAVVSTGVIAEVVRRHHLTGAWAFIPRRRQDRHRPDPTTWSLLRAAVLSLSMVAGVVLILAGFAERAHESGIRSYSVGAAAGVAVTMLAAAAWEWWHSRGRTAGLEACLVALTVAVGVATVVAAGLIPRSLDLLAAALGGLILGVIQAVWGWTSSRAQRRR
jgi:hypothetical protein